MKIKYLVFGILAVVLLYAGLTAYQLSGAVKMINDKEFEPKLKKVIEGDCSGYEAVIEEIDSRISKLKSGCMNPLIVFLSSKSESDLCKGIKDPDNQIYDIVEQIKLRCAAS